MLFYTISTVSSSVMFSFSRIYATVAGRSKAIERSFQDFVERTPTQAENDTQSCTAIEDATNSERGSRSHSLSSGDESTDEGSRADSGICLDYSPQLDGEPVIELICDGIPPLEEPKRETEAFPALDPLLLAKDSLEAEDLCIASHPDSAISHDHGSEARNDNLPNNSSESSADEEPSRDSAAEITAVSEVVKPESTAINSASISKISVFSERFEERQPSQPPSPEHQDVSQPRELEIRNGSPCQTSADLHSQAGLETAAAKLDDSSEDINFSSLNQTTPSKTSQTTLNEDPEEISSVSLATTSAPPSPKLGPNPTPGEIQKWMDFKLARAKKWAAEALEASDGIAHDPPDAPNDPNVFTPPPHTGHRIFNLSKTLHAPSRKQVYRYVDFQPTHYFFGSGQYRNVQRRRPCLQCVLKDIQCDQRIPSCTRCVRSGSSSHCLIQRRLASWEIRRLGLQEIDYIVPVRLPEDNDTIWAEKLEIEEGLLEQLQERIDKRNWVYPVNDGGRGGYELGDRRNEVRGQEVDEERGRLWEYKTMENELMVPLSN
jgi:hypothetical protein